MILFGPEICRNLEAATQREWLETNGLGGFASSTLIGLNTRRYHGLLTAALPSPVGRYVLLSKFEESRHIFLRDGKLYEPGETFRQPELARALAQIAGRGPDAFYRGPIAEAVQRTMQAYGGLITLADLEQYQARLRQPLEGHFRGFTVLTVPPPSSGGVALLEMLNVLEPLDLGAPNSFDSMHLLTETMRRAYADRAAYLGDADFVAVPVKHLISSEYAAKLREQILTSKPEAPV